MIDLFEEKKYAIGKVFPYFSVQNYHFLPITANLAQKKNSFFADKGKNLKP